MFLAHGNQRCAYRNRVSLRNDVYDDFFSRRDRLIHELEVNCVSISFTLDLWTSPNRTPILAVIGHWYTPDFEEKEEVLEFVEVHGSHTGEVLAEAVLRVLEELKIKHKLFAITGDSAGNNGTLCQSLYNSLKHELDDRFSPIGRPRMRFHGKSSWIRCLAHVIALICKDVLGDLKAGSAKEAKRMLDSWDVEFKTHDYVLPHEDGRSAVAKVRLLNLWILRSSGREQKWKAMPKTRTRRPVYDVDTRWNSTYDMITQFLELEAEYSEFTNAHAQVKCLLLTPGEIVALHQLAHVLRPFKELALKLSESMPSLAMSLEIYWDLDDLLDNVINGKEKYAELDPIIQDAFKSGKSKHLKYSKLSAKNAMLFAAHILDPRCKASMIAMMMPNQRVEMLKMVKKYMITEWPALDEVQLPDIQPELDTERPEGMSIAFWRMLLGQRQKVYDAGMQGANSELERWLQSEPLALDPSTRKDPDFLRKWWKNHACEWPRLAYAARDLLACSSSEVDVERLFSGCRDEYGVRRHALKAETVRVMSLLRSAYSNEDNIDSERIKEAYLLSLGNLQHPCYFPS
jgi:hAT family C-terminal dimerisation region